MSGKGTLKKIQSFLPVLFATVVLVIGVMEITRIKAIVQNPTYLDDPREMPIKHKWVKSPGEIPTGSLVYIIQKPEIVYLISRRTMSGKSGYFSGLYYDGHDFYDRDNYRKISSQRVSWDRKYWRFSGLPTLYFFGH